MKRFIVIPGILIVGILAAWLIIDAYASPTPETDGGNMAIKVNVETNEMQNANRSGDLAVPLTGVNMKIAPMFDATGAIVSDPTGTILSVIQSGDMAVPVAGSEMKIAPVFDVQGAVVSDPTGTILSANQSGDMAVPVAGSEMKIAPVFDVTGAVVSDPTGTILSVIHP